MNFKLLIPALVFSAIFVSCKKDKTVVEQTKGSVAFKFENYVGNQPLALSTEGYNYRNENADSFSVTVYKYYVSNVRFVKADGTEHLSSESYFLIDESLPSSLSRVAAGIPTGTYTSIKMLLGVDSLRNVSGAQSGDLDPLHGMFWSWSTGYIMAKVEGNFKKTDNNNASFSLHLGGFTGKFRVVHDVELTLPQQLVVAQNKTSKVSLSSDVLKWFYGFVTVNLQAMNQVGSEGNDARELSLNFKNAFSVTSVSNE